MEVEHLARLFGPDRSTVLIGENATESRMDEFAEKDRLRDFATIHLATHGMADPLFAFQSRLLFAEGTSTRNSESSPDGIVTAEHIARSWKLDADLVVLSACETALGPSSGGEGLLGFSYALFKAGARNAMVSLWSVPDVPSAMLLERFYCNALGRREGLGAPLPRAEALDEAKRWLTRLDRSRNARRMGQALRDDPSEADRSRTPRLKTVRTSHFLGGVRAHR